MLSVFSTIKEYEKSSEGALYILVSPSGVRSRGRCSHGLSPVPCLRAPDPQTCSWRSLASPSETPPHESGHLPPREAGDLPPMRLASPAETSHPRPRGPCSSGSRSLPASPPDINDLEVLGTSVTVPPPALPTHSLPASPQRLAAIPLPHPAPTRLLEPGGPGGPWP